MKTKDKHIEAMKNALTDDWQATSQLSYKTNMIFYRALDILEYLESEGEVECHQEFQRKYWRIASGKNPIAIATKVNI